MIRWGSSSRWTIPNFTHVPDPDTGSQAEYCIRGNRNNLASNVTLSAVINWPNLNGLTYSFEYQTGSGSFQVFAVTANPVISVSDYSTLVNFLNSSSTTSVGFRVRVIASNDTSQYGGNSVSFSPPPPKVGSFLPTDACGGGALGTIQLNRSPAWAIICMSCSLRHLVIRLSRQLYIGKIRSSQWE